MTDEQTKQQEKIKQELKQNHGTTQYHKIPFSHLVYTDGINDLIEKCKCWWLISDLGIEIAHDEKLQKPFLVVKVEVDTDKQKGRIILKEDTDEKPIYIKELNYTDFPLSDFEFWISNEVFLLKSEY